MLQLETCQVKGLIGYHNTERRNRHCQSPVILYFRPLVLIEGQRLKRRYFICQYDAKVTHNDKTNSVLREKSNGPNKEQRKIMLETDV